MSFTYNLSHSDSTKQTISRIRLRIGDTVRGAGPLPDGSNFQDEEISDFYTEEGSHVMRTVAACLETLAARWSAHAGTYRLGPESESNQQAERYQDAAEKLRKRHGYATDTTTDAHRAAVVAHVKPAGQT